MLTKSNYIQYLQCQKLLWIAKNKKELIPEPSETTEAMFAQGYEVEDWARKLFTQNYKKSQGSGSGARAKAKAGAGSGAKTRAKAKAGAGSGACLEIGAEVQANFQKGQAETKNLIENGETLIFQATAMPKDLLARSDIFKYNPRSKSWDIYEVKSSTELKEDLHIPDLCFQKIAFERDGYKIGKTYLIHIDNEYIRNGEIEPEKLFKIEDLSTQVENYRSTAEANIPKAIKLIAQSSAPTVDLGKHCKNPYPCPLKDFCWSFLPEYSIYNLQRINESKLRMLRNMNILKLVDIPDDMPLSASQQNQIQVAKTGETILDRKSIASTLDRLEYPLYFLDYETYSSAIPLFDGTNPYQNICFQYSLHVIEKPNGKVEHYEFLHTEQSNPIPKLLTKMQQHIGKTGSVIVWNKSFEMTRNEEMGKQYPKYKSFLKSVNDRVFDLMEIFRKQYFVHPDFRGSCSIKKVLPVVVPSLNHHNLEGIQEGGTASLYWFKHIFSNSPEKAKITDQLLKYCELDTLAMVEIFKELQ